MKENYFDFSGDYDSVFLDNCEILISNIKRELEVLQEGLKHDKELIGEIRFIIDNILNNSEERKD